MNAGELAERLWHKANSPGVDGRYYTDRETLDGIWAWYEGERRLPLVDRALAEAGYNNVVFLGRAWEVEPSEQYNV